jgi:regulatory protein
LKDLQNKAKQYALKLLSYRGRSEKELKERMTGKGFSDTLISSTIDHLRKLGFVNDVSLAESLKREATANKFFSRNSARRYMLNRGISRDIIHTVCGQDGEEDLQNAQRYIEKKFRVLKSFPPATVKRRLYAQLLRRGYSPETISTVLKNTLSTEED